VLVTIADRGRGFNAAAGSAGLGLRDSIGARLAEVGGTATVDSRPGQGTSVELRWPG
jgi:signal transduction histidine kinase